MDEQIRVLILNEVDYHYHYHYNQNYCQEREFNHAQIIYS